MAREGQSATGLARRHRDPALPLRARHAAARWPSPAAARPPTSAPRTGPADLVFLIAAPAGGGAEHLKLLSALARALVKPEFKQSLRSAATPQEVVRSSATS
jgi:PTS system fructose-specific IIC component